MTFDIDIAIFVLFLIVTLIVGLYYSQGIKTIKEYAVGDRNFSTPTLAATIVATWICGGFFTITITKTYTEGIKYIILALCEVMAFVVLSAIFVPRMNKLIGNISVAEAMSTIYKGNARLITSIVGLIMVIGTVAIQFKVCATIFSYFFTIPSTQATIISACIVIGYSAFGGIKAVTFTDILQVITFSLFIPILSFAIWKTMSEPISFLHLTTHNPAFNKNSILSGSFYDNLEFFCLIILFIVPGLDPAIFQRISMCKDSIQAKKSFLLAALFFLLISLIIFWFTMLLILHNPNLEKDQIISYIIDQYTYPVFKGLFLSGMLAMIMSTADSYINSASILFAHDFCMSLEAKWIKKRELLVSRISTIYIGLFAIVIALIKDDLFDIILIMASIYMPLVTTPLLMYIFRFKTNYKSYRNGICLGLISVSLFTWYDVVDESVSSVLSMVIVAITMLCTRNFLSIANDFNKNTKNSVIKIFGSVAYDW